MLLEQPISFAVGTAGEMVAWKARTELRAGDHVDIGVIGAETLPVKAAYGYIWTSLGNPPDDLFPIPEYGENDRRNISRGPIGVQVSAPRAIENFLDMGHFPYVHTDILGAEPHTEVKEYDVEISPSATKSSPRAAASSSRMAALGVDRRGRGRIYLPRAAPVLLGALQIVPGRRDAAWTSSPSSCSR